MILYFVAFAQRSVQGLLRGFPLCLGLCVTSSDLSFDWIGRSATFIGGPWCTVSFD